MIEAYITNLGKYNEGELCGEYLRLPSTKEEVQALLSRIGVDGVLYEEFFITDYETDIEGLHDCLGEYESIDELNYLAVLLEDLDSWELEKFTAALEDGEYTSSLGDLINLTQNTDYYDYYPDVHNVEDLGYYMVDELCMLEIPENLQPYFDYEAYGRDCSLDMCGTFTDKGYIVSGADSFIEHYGGRGDIPDKYKIFAYPDPPGKMRITDQLKMFGRMVSEYAVSERPAPALEER